MFCPKCATQNMDGASFCRACGANVSLIPQALTGRLPESQPDRYQGRRRRRQYEEENPTLEKGIVNLFIGIGFIIAGIAVMMKFPAGFTWGWALFIPGFSCIGRGVASIVGARAKQKQIGAGTATLNALTSPTPISQPTSPFLGEPTVRNTGQMMPPVPSVTEGTTRHLGSEARTQHFDSIENQKS